MLKNLNSFLLCILVSEKSVRHLLRDSNSGPLLAGLVI